jgi:hypothetical protein
MLNTQSDKQPKIYPRIDLIHDQQKPIPPIIIGMLISRWNPCPSSDRFQKPPEPQEASRLDNAIKFAIRIISRFNMSQIDCTIFGRH